VFKDLGLVALIGLVRWSVRSSSSTAGAVPAPRATISCVADATTRAPRRTTTRRRPRRRRLRRPKPFLSRCALVTSTARVRGPPLRPQGPGSPAATGYGPAAAASGPLPALDPGASAGPCQATPRAGHSLPSRTRGARQPRHNRCWGYSADRTEPWSGVWNGSRPYRAPDVATARDRGTRRTIAGPPAPRPWGTPLSCDGPVS
jgi:hypothetical protein